MGNHRIDTTGVRFRTVIAHDRTEDSGTNCLKAHSELARELRYQPARG